MALGALGLLAVRGRLPMRAAASVLVPACALALWLLWHSLLRLRGRGLARRVALTALALLLGLVAVKGVRSAWGDIYNPVFTRAPESTNRFTQLETYAMAHPDRSIARRAFEAMMTMGKIDVARIQAAVRG